VRSIFSILVLPHFQHFSALPTEVPQFPHKAMGGF
jgi:hypothetical protein